MSQANGERLDSWKEIATYLGRDLRTVRRWEENGLPVHRVPGGERRAVFAYRGEIDAWMKGQGNGSSTQGGVNGALAAERAPAESATVAVPVGAGARRPRLRVSANSGLFVAAVLCGLGVGAFLLWRTSRGPVAQVAFSGNAVVARDGKGDVLWSYPFDTPLNPGPDSSKDRLQVMDLGSDRQRDALVLAPFASAELEPTLNDALFCFSAKGRPRWSHVFKDTFRFGGNDYGPPWMAWSLMVTSDRSSPRIWAVAREGLSSPSMLMGFDRDGRQLAEFVNWGHIATLKGVRNGSGSYILVGGISNQCNCAMLAVLKEDSPSGSSPPLEPAYACENCPEGRPYRYFLFPRSELTLLSGVAYNSVQLIQVDKGHVWAGVRETNNGGFPGADWIKYDLTDDFVPKSFTISDHFWTFHSQMESEGKIRHTVGQCPEGVGPRRVQMWSAERGWEWISVPKSTER